MLKAAMDKEQTASLEAINQMLDKYK